MMGRKLGVFNACFVSVIFPGRPLHFLNACFVRDLAKRGFSYIMTKTELEPRTKGHSYPNNIHREGIEVVSILPGPAFYLSAAIPTQLSGGGQISGRNHFRGAHHGATTGTKVLTGPVGSQRGGPKFAP